ncbi:MAG: hypothetical protein WAM82_10925 [Thermoanaerobaculia bacterium]
MTYPGWLRLSLLSLVLLASGLVFRAAAAPPAAPASTPPAAAAEPQQADAEQQAKVEAEKKAKAEAQTQKKINAEKRTQTLADIRRLGTALYTWLKDQVAATVAEREAESAAAGEPPPQDPDVANAKRQTYDVQDNPLISREDLEDFLVPDYLAQIPETDGWGNPYEVRINTDNLMARTVISIRSPGRKGYYSGDVYKVGGFDPTDFDQDIVWADGFFVRSPKSP